MEVPKKIVLSECLHYILNDIPEALSFIESLQDEIYALQKKLERIFLNKAVKCNVETQTDYVERHAPLAQQQFDLQDAESSSPMVPQKKSIAEEITAAAELAVRTNGMAYDKTSGLYYDYTTGFYYNAEYGLYYDSANATYLTYDPQTGQYSFYSKVDDPQHAAKVVLESGPTVLKREQRESDSGSSREKHYDKKDVQRRPPHRRRKGRLSDSDSDYEFTIDGLTQSLTNLEVSPASKHRVPQSRRKRCRRRADRGEVDEHLLELDDEAVNSDHEYERDRRRSRRGSSRDRRRRRRIDDRRYKRRMNGRRHSRYSSEDREEGECTEDDVVLVTTPNQSDEVISLCSSDERDSGKATDDLTAQYPPCIRVITEQSTLPTLKVGSLHVIPYTGGTLGREGGQHSVIVPDINVSKFHLKFMYDEKQKKYKVMDVGSRNGTLLNGSRMAPSKKESDNYELVHGSRLQVGGVVLLCHIHQGTQTCGHCEPGLIQPIPEATPVDLNSLSKSEEHKKTLKQLMKRFGLSHYDTGKVDPGTGYKDRAQTRRAVVGSTDASEKTQVQSINDSIPTQNKGFKMLEKMGWSEGTSLGKDNSGLLEPINVVANPGTSGMGSTAPFVNSVVKSAAMERNTITKMRFDKVMEEKPASDDTENIFDY